MKKSIIVTLLLLGTLRSFAQTDSTKVEQYCQVIATPRLFSNKVTIDIDFGDEKKFWADNRLRAYTGKAIKFNTIIDAMNFMGKDGWLFINAYPVKIGDTEIFHFAFKKMFHKSEIL
jgi:hypothetical protein